MKVTRRQLRRFILEQESSTDVLKKAIEDDLQGAGGADDPENVNAAVTQAAKSVGVDVPDVVDFIDKNMSDEIGQLDDGDLYKKPATESFSRAKLRSIILEELAKLPIYKKYSYGIDDIPDAGKAEDDIIGHT